MKFLKIFGLSLMAFFALTQFATAKTHIDDTSSSLSKVKPIGPIQLPVVNVHAANVTKSKPALDKKTKSKKVKKHPSTKMKTPKESSKPATSEQPVKKDYKGHVLRN